MSQVEQVEVNIEHAKEKVELGKALERLAKNRDFKKIIMDGYLKDEVVRTMTLKAHPMWDHPVKQERLNRALDGASFLQAYLGQIEQEAEVYARAIAEDEATLAELREQELAQ